MDGPTEAPRPKSFTYNELKSAAGGFDVKNKLGRGGFSTVYKVSVVLEGHIFFNFLITDSFLLNIMYHIYQGVQRDGKTVAIKKLEISDNGGKVKL